MTFEVPALTIGIHELKFNIISGGFELDYLDFAMNTAPDNAPAGVTAERTSGDLIEVKWDEVEKASSYMVKRAESEAGPFETIAEGILGNSYLDENISALKTYYYKIAAQNLAGEGPESEVIESPGLPLSVDNLEKEKHIEIYPNPSNGEFQISLTSPHKG